MQAVGVGMTDLHSGIYGRIIVSPRIPQGRAAGLMLEFPCSPVVWEREQAGNTRMITHDTVANC